VVRTRQKWARREVCLIDPTLPEAQQSRLRRTEYAQETLWLLLVIKVVLIGGLAVFGPRLGWSNADIVQLIFVFVIFFGGASVGVAFQLVIRRRQVKAGRAVWVQAGPLQDFYREQTQKIEARVSDDHRSRLHAMLYACVKKLAELAAAEGMPQRYIFSNAKACEERDEMIAAIDMCVQG
jgi:phage shock protein PspC (stress-responsive transcriptional regulator)